MSEILTPAEDSPARNSDTQNTRAPNANRNVTTRTNRTPNRTGSVHSTTNHDFDGATPKLNAILALRHENVTKKVNYDRFLEKLAICVINELMNGDSIIEITKNPKCNGDRRFSKGQQAEGIK